MRFLSMVKMNEAKMTTTPKAMMDAINAMVLMAFGIVSGQAEAATFALCNRALGVLYQVGLVLIVFAVLGRHWGRAEADVAATESETDRG